ncbi:MAG: DUF6152 family protein [Steroidobacteraceae bacterium]|jgi:hypothetical protein
MFRYLVSSSRAVSLALALIGASAAQAHHSAAGVDQNKTITVSGTLKDFDFSAPHSQIIVVSQDDTGAMVETRVSTVAPNALVKQGFKAKDFVVGDKVEMSYHPNLNGAGGLMVTLKLGDGRVVKGSLY